MKPTYQLSSDLRSIKCKLCGFISFNIEDAMQKYCSHCKVFHGDLRACMWCDEAVLPDDMVSPVKGVLMHWACGLRSVIGGLNHQLKKCSCCGGDQPPDPPEMTARQAAVAAVEYYYRMEHAHACDPKTPQEVPPQEHTG